MNKHIIKGKYKEVKGEVKERVGRATDKPMTELSGKVDKFVGNVQKEYGKGKDEGEREAKRQREQES